MKGAEKAFLISTLTVGLAGFIGESEPTSTVQRSPLEKPTVSAPLPSVSNSGENSEFVIPVSSPTVDAQTQIFTPSPTPEATPEISGPKCVFPLKEFVIISRFLDKRQLEDYVSDHLGLDISTQKNRDVLSPCEGTFIFAGRTSEDNTRRLGNVVVIKYKWNGEPIYAIFAHLETMIEGKKEGDKISTSEVIGKMGHSGTYATNIHLHLQVWNQTGWEKIAIGLNKKCIEKYGLVCAAGTYPPFGEDKVTIEKYLINPLTWLEDVTGQEVKYIYP